jgi:thiamine pyrophosphokinase
MWPKIATIRFEIQDNALPQPVHDPSAVTLVGGGIVNRRDLDLSLSLAPRLVAADGGANRAASLGHLPEQVIGDLDSIAPDLRARLGDRVLHVPEQDSTDLDKCLSRIRAPFVLGLGFDGARLDHTLAAMTSLTRHGSARVLLLAAEDIVFLAPPRLHLGLDVGERVSLFPMGQVAGRSTGLHWPIEGIPFTPEALVGTSNRASAPEVTLHSDRPAMLVLLERARLTDALSAVLAVPDWQKGL